jgi:hypothetical protein
MFSHALSLTLLAIVVRQMILEHFIVLLFGQCWNYLCCTTMFERWSLSFSYPYPFVSSLVFFLYFFLFLSFWITDPIQIIIIIIILYSMSITWGVVAQSPKPKAHVKNARLT